jgi:hemoglobin-like flavoprotein
MHGVSDSRAEFVRTMERCIARPAFFERFYTRFLASSPDIAAKFAKVDMKRQASVLRASLYHVMRAAQGMDDGLRHLEEIAESHSRRGHDIRPEHYETWLECLLAAARDVEPAFDATTEGAWRLHLGEAIHTMVARR